MWLQKWPVRHLHGLALPYSFQLDSSGLVVWANGGLATIWYEDPLSICHLGGLIPHLLDVLMLDATRSRLHPSNTCTHSSFPQSMTILFWYLQEEGVTQHIPKYVTCEHNGFVFCRIMSFLMFVCFTCTICIL